MMEDNGGVIGKDEIMTYEMRIRLPTRRIAEIIRNSIDVDPEFSIEIKRKINVEDQGLIFNYTFKAQYMKNFKKSVKAMYENLQLVLETIKDYAPK